MLVKYDGHACVVNSKLLEKVEGKVSKLRGYHPESGEMNQEAFFAVSDFITGSLSIPELVGNIQHAMDYLASRGIGMVHDVSGVGFAGNLDISLETWLARSAQSGFQIRVFPQSMDVRVATRRRLPRIGGCFACALDGCFGSTDAALLAPYEGADDSGVLYYTDEQVIDFCRTANRAGLQIEMHAIGDAAFDQACRALAAALDDFPRNDHRHGIIHACLPTTEGLDICERYHIQLPMQTSFIDWPQEPDSYLERVLGPKRASRLNPLRTTSGTAASCSRRARTHPAPTPTPSCGCNAPATTRTPPSRSPCARPCAMCTYNGAWATFDERDRGSLEAGKLADMAILSANPYEVGPAGLGNLRVEGLILGGRPYEPQRQGVVAAVTRGMLARGGR